MLEKVKEGGEKKWGEEATRMLSLRAAHV